MEGLALGVGLDELVGELGVDVGELVDLGAALELHAEDLARGVVAEGLEAPWARGQRCIIPMDAFFESNWETGRHIRWKFGRRDGAPIAVAGLWERWRGKGAEHEVTSYTLLTVKTPTITR